MKRSIATMNTLKADAKQRVRIPDAKPHQVFAYSNNGDGSFTLTDIKAQRKPAFPRGSLLKYFTAEKNREELARLTGCVQAPQPEGYFADAYQDKSRAKREDAIAKATLQRPEVPKVRPVQTKEGFLMLPRALDRQAITAAIRKDRDAQ